MSIRDSIVESLLVVPDLMQISTPRRAFGTGTAAIGANPTPAGVNVVITDGNLTPFSTDDGIWFDKLNLQLLTSNFSTLTGLALGVTWAGGANAVWPLGTPELTILQFAGINTVVFPPQLMLMRDLFDVYIRNGGTGNLPQPIQVVLNMSASTQVAGGANMITSMYVHWRRITGLQEN